MCSLFRELNNSDEIILKQGRFFSLTYDPRRIISLTVGTIQHFIQSFAAAKTAFLYTSSYFIRYLTIPRILKSCESFIRSAIAKSSFDNWTATEYFSSYGIANFCTLLTVFLYRSISLLYISLLFLRSLTSFFSVSNSE